MSNLKRVFRQVILYRYNSYRIRQLLRRCFKRMMLWIELNWIVVLSVLLESIQGILRLYSQLIRQPTNNQPVSTFGSFLSICSSKWMMDAWNVYWKKEDGIKTDSMLETSVPSLSINFYWNSNWESHLCLSGFNRPVLIFLQMEVASHSGGRIMMGVLIDSTSARSAIWSANSTFLYLRGPASEVDFRKHRPSTVTAKEDSALAWTPCSSGVNYFRDIRWHLRNSRPVGTTNRRIGWNTEASRPRLSSSESVYLIAICLSTTFIPSIRFAFDSLSCYGSFQY